MPYHNNPVMLAMHYTLLRSLPDDVKRGIEVVICDDASDEPAFYPAEDIGVPVRIFRITGDHVPWSHRCATNIAAHESRGFWLVVTDIDHLVPLETWRYLMDDHRRPPLRTDRAYWFARRNLDGGEYKPHPDSWLFHCSLWDQVKGYDERYRGAYGQNYPFIQRVAAYARTDHLPVPLIRVSRDDIPDASERVLTRKSDEAKKAQAMRRRDIMREGSFYRDTRLSAAYQEVPKCA